MKHLLFAAALAVALMSTGCSTARRPAVSSWGQPVTKGFKPLDQVAPHARPMVLGKETLAECMRRPESIADGGAGCMNAIEDLPVR
jgi:hypothetical protein